MAGCYIANTLLCSVNSTENFSRNLDYFSSDVYRYDTCDVLTNFLGQNLYGRETFAGRGMFWQPFDGNTNSLKTFEMVLIPKDFDRE